MKGNLGWRDENRRFRFTHGCGAVLASAVLELLERGGYCAACIDRMPDPATDAQWDACLIPAEQWRQVLPPTPKPAPGTLVTIHLPGDLVPQENGETT